MAKKYAVDIDTLSWQLPVKDKDLTSPPAATIGDRYIVASGGSGAWNGQDKNIAWYDENSTWKFITVSEGMFIWVVDEDKLYIYDGSNWGIFIDLASPGAIGGTTPSTGSFTTLTASGLISANGGQIKFPSTAVSSSDPNTLDDYEEGTWTPDLRFGGNKVGITYGVQVGRYVKCGSSITLIGRFDLTSKGSSAGWMGVYDLPFASKNVTSLYQVPSFHITNITYGGSIQGWLAKNSTTLSGHSLSEAGATSDITNTNFSNTSRVMVSMVYISD